jgi:hypothetical protein
MGELHEIVLREAVGTSPNPPGLIAELKTVFLEIFPDVTDAGCGWLKGKSDQEVAKAIEIRASALAKLGQLENERQKLIVERDAAILKAETEHARDRMAHEAKMFELRTQRKAERLRGVVEALKTLKDLGVQLEAKTLKQISAKLVSALDDND